MQPTHFVLFAVARPEASARFYERLLQRPPVEVSPTFAMFALGEGLMLGLWDREGMQPAVTVQPGASELAFVLADDKAVDALHARWAADGVTIAQAPTRMDFGYTCVGIDPDGHRLRAFAPGA
jgi:predicted enzyme related to lactoylglutathione lyase